MQPSASIMELCNDLAWGVFLGIFCRPSLLYHHANSPWCFPLDSLRDVRGAAQKACPLLRFAWKVIQVCAPFVRRVSVWVTTWVERSKMMSLYTHKAVTLVKRIESGPGWVHIATVQEMGEEP